MRPARMLLLPCVFVLACVCRGADDFSDGLVARDAVLATAAQITPERYPNSDEVLVENEIRVTYAADGTSQTWDDEYVKVLTEKGKRNRKSYSFYFTLPYGTVEIKRMEVIKPDGSVVPVDVAKQSRVMIDRSQMSENIYNPNHKILQVTVPDIEIGDVCHVIAFRNTVKPRVPNTWSDYTVLEYTMPMKHVRYVVIGPKTLPLRNIELRDEIPGTVSYKLETDGARNRYCWEIHDVPRMFSEPNMPPLYTVVQRLLVSTIPDWQAISKWYWQLSEPHLNAVTREMKREVRKLTAGTRDRRTKIERLFQYVSQQVRYMGITTEKEAPGYEPHDVSITFKNRYGVCRDKGALLVAMLRLARLPAYPVLIHTGPKKDADVPQPYFNHAVVAVADGRGSYILMDPTMETTTDLFPAWLANKSYLVAQPKGETLLTSPVDPATNNLVRIESSGKIDEDGALHMVSTLKFEGVNDNAYRGYFARIKTEERRRFFQGLLKRRIAGAKLNEFAINPANLQDTAVPMTVRLEYEAPDYLILGDTHAMMAPPWLGTSVGYVNFVLGKTGLKKRKYPLFTEIACGIRETFELTLGEQVGELIAAPAYRPVETNTLRFSRSLAQRENTLHGTTSFLIEAVEFAPDEYLALKDMLKEMEYQRRMRPVFAAAGRRKTTVDARVLLRSTRLELADAQNWTATREQHLEVLTYAGKKRYAELKLSYNPAWEEIELQTATVVNPDGSEHQVVDEEINVMDAGWVGSAPRYPPGKTMVVSLPGVEVGSRIAYRVVKKVKGKPFFSTRRSFRDFEPVETNILQIVAPESLALTVQEKTGPTVDAAHETRDGKTYRRWTRSQQPPLAKEDALPPFWSFTDTVLVSAGNWAGYCELVAARLREAAGQQSQTRAKALSLTHGMRGPAEKATAIRDFVAKNIRAAGPDLADLPLSAISPADTTLQEAYGNTTDRAILLAAMLDAAGLEPELVLASSWAPHLPRLYEPLLDPPQRGAFDTVLVRITIDGREVYLNDSDQYARLGSTPHDRQPALTLDGTPLTIRAWPEMRDHTSVHYEIALEPDGDATITMRESFFGSAFASFHRYFAELPPEERRRYYRELVAHLSQAAEAETDLATDYQRYPGIKSFTARVPRYAVRSGDYLYLTLPGARDRVPGVRADRRENPLYISDITRAETTYTVRLPDAARSVLLMPKERRLDAPADMGTLESKTETQRENGRPNLIRITRKTELHDAVVPAADYPALLEMNRKISHPDTATLLIEME